MTNEERMREIEERDYIKESVCTCGKDVPWLWARVRQLEGALKTLRFTGGLFAKADDIARKALESPPTEETEK